MSRIVAETFVDSNPSSTWGNLITGGIQYEDGTPVIVHRTLYIKFLAPVVKEIQLNAQLNPWQEVSTKFSSKPASDGNGLEVTAEILFTSSHKFALSDSLTWGIGGDLTGDVSRYTSSFAFHADRVPSGFVQIAVGPVPDPTLSDVKQIITLTDNGIIRTLEAAHGQTTSFSVANGVWTVEAGRLVNADDTVTFQPSVYPTAIEVREDQTTQLEVSYRPA